MHFSTIRALTAGKLAPALATLFAATLLTIGAGCDGDARSCSTDDDCFGNEVCQEGVCFRLDDQDASTGTDTSQGDTGGNNGTGNNGTGNNGGADASGGNNGGTDTGSDTGNSQCQLEAFDTCIDDDPYQPATAESPHKLVPDEHEEDTYETMGCWAYQDVSWGDVFGPAPDPVQGKLCPATDDNLTDSYRILYDQCSYAYSFDIFVRVTTCQEHRDALQIGIETFGSDMEDYCDEQTTDGSHRHFICHTGEGDFEYLLREDVTDASSQLWDHHIRVRVPGRSSTPTYYRSTRLNLSADPAENVPLDYEIKVEVTNPGG